MLLKSLALIALALLVWAAITDLAQRRIANWVSAGVIATFALAAVAAPDRVDFLSGLALALPVFVALLTGFAFGSIGGGDVKLLTAGACWVGLSGALEYLVLTGLAGGVLALIYLSPTTSLALGWFRHVVVRGWSPALADGGPSGDASVQLPYGVAIACGGGFVLVSRYLLA
jgi:prepilin peptidase CpaA